MEDMPTKIIVIITSLLILGIGIFVVGVFIWSTDSVSSTTETFDVTDPSVEQVVTLKYTPSETPDVDQYNGITWVNVESTYFSYTGTTLTVQPGGLQG